jgi:uncharacterized protein
MSRELPFDPFPLLHGPHHQTIISSFFNLLFEPSSDQKLVRLPDGDKISLEITTPREWKPEDPTVFLVHGLCGSHKSPNMVRMAKRLEPMGIKTVRYNMRGCGSGKGLAKQIYHSGRSEDVFESIKAMKMENPASPITLIGFSLGANIVLKMAGELGTLARAFIQKMIAVSPPVDLFSSVLMLGHPDNGMYEKYFYKLLRADVHHRQKIFKDLPRIQLPRNLKIYEFDQIYTVPTCGFKSANDYYTRCSSAQFVPDIAIPCKVLFAEDDPIVSCYSLDGVSIPSNVEVYRTKKGGHMGYLGHPQSEKGFHWLDSVLVDWIKDP